MIFVTVGAQMPFDRLIVAMDRWAEAHPGAEIVAQIGASAFRPKAMRWVRFLSPEEYDRHYRSAKFVVAHAGTGSIIAALQLGKPIVIMPRQAALMETRNDHQLATAQQFSRFPSVLVASGGDELSAKLDMAEGIGSGRTIGQYASDELLTAIRSFIGECSMRAN